MANDNKGKFSDRLKRMKLFRYSKMMKLKVKGLSLVRDNNLEKKVINGSAVTITFVGNDINNVINHKETVNDNGIVKNNNLKNKMVSVVSVGAAVVGNGINNVINQKDTVDNSKINDNNDFNVVNKYDLENENQQKSVDNNINILDKDDNVVENSNLKNKMISAASVGAAVVGAVGVNLLGGNSFKNDRLNSNLSFDKSVDNINNNKKNDDNLSSEFEKKELSFGDQSKRSFKQVFKSGNDIILVDKINDKDIFNGDRKTYLAAQIIKKTKDEFEKKLSVLEVLETELYFLNEKNENELDLEKCKNIKKEIEDVLDKINHIIEQYNIYKYNQLLINTINIDDRSLADDICEFKDLYEGAEIQRRLASDYDLVCMYQSFYDNLENIKSDFDEVWKNNEDKVIDYEKRDKKYEKINESVENIDKFNKDCEYFADVQNKYISDIKSKVSKIDVDKVINYKLRGFGNLVGGSLRLLTSLFTRPFSSTLGGIAFQTYNTNRMVNNLRNVLRLERITNTIYSVENMQSELDKRIENIDYNSDCISDSLSNVDKLRKEFMEQYNYDIPGYNETLSKINEIETMLNNNQVKLNTIKNKLKINKKLNENALHRAKILEKESKPIVERI